MLLLYLLFSETFKWQPSQNSHLSNEKAKPHAEICPFLNSTIYSYSHLLVKVIKAILRIIALAVACVFTVIFYLRLHWITAKRAHPLSPAKQETRNLTATLSNNNSHNYIWKQVSSLTSITIAGNLKPIVLDVLEEI